MERIVPYMVVDGIPNIPDSDLAWLYLSLVAEGLEKKAFYDGSVQCASDFVRLFKSPGQLLFVVMRGETIVMISWLNSLEGKRVRANFSMFKQGFGKDSFEVGKRVIDHYLSLSGPDGFLFDVIYGVTPTSNKLACKYVKKIMNVSAIIPNFCFNYWDKTTSDGLITYTSRKADIGVSAAEPNASFSGECGK
jgi:hypothetical protein